MTAPDQFSLTKVDFGVDSKTNDNVQPAQTLRRAEEARYDQPGVIEKRPGPTTLAALELPFGTGEAEDHKFRSVLEAAGMLGVRHDCGLLAWTDGGDELAQRPVPESDADRGRGAAGIAADPAPIGQIVGCSEYAGSRHTLVGQADLDGFVTVRSYDATTGVEMSRQSLNEADAVTLVTCDGSFLVSEKDGVYQIARYSDAGKFWTFYTSFATSLQDRSFGVASLGVGDSWQYWYVLGPTDSFGALDPQVIYAIDKSNGQVDHQFSTDLAPAFLSNCDIDVVRDGANVTILVASYPLNDTMVRYRRYSDNGTAISAVGSGSVGITSIEPTQVGIVGVWAFAEADTRAYIVTSGDGDTGGTDAVRTRCYRVTFAETLASLFQVYDSIQLGKPFRMGGGQFQMLMHDESDTDPATFPPDWISVLIQFEPNDTSRYTVAGHFGVDRGYDPGQKASTSPGYNPYRQINHLSPQAAGNNDRAWVLHPDFPATSNSLQQMSRPMRLALDESPGAFARFQGGALTIDATLQQWISGSGEGLQPNAFPWRPRFVFLSPGVANPDNEFPAGLYIGAIVIAWTDDLGRVHRSAPSLTKSYAAGDAWVPRFDDVFLPPGGPNDVVEYYLSEDTGTRLKFIGSQLRSSLNQGANGSPPDGGYFRPGIEPPQKFIYTDGGELENTAQPAAHDGALILDRLWLGDDGDRSTWWFSKPSQEGVAFEFNPEFRVRIPGGAGGTAIAQLDGRPLMFTRTAIWTVYGDGPLRTGAGQFSLPAQIGDVGTVNFASVIETPAGVFFAGERGLYVVARGLQTQPVALGADYEFNAAEIVRATHDEHRTEIHFHRRTGAQDDPPFGKRNGGTLVYNYVLQKLSTWPTVDAVDAVHREFVDVSSYIDEANLYALDSATWDGSLQLVTPWIRLGEFEANATIRELVFTAERLDLSGVTFGLWFDYEDSALPTESFSFGAAAITQILDGHDVFTLTMVPERQVARAVKIQVIEIETTGRGFKALSLGLNTSREDGIQRRYADAGRQ